MACECEKAFKEGYLGAMLYDSKETLEEDVKMLGLVKGAYRVVDFNGDDGPLYYLHIKEDWTGWVFD